MMAWHIYNFIVTAAQANFNASNWVNLAAEGHRWCWALDFAYPALSLLVSLLLLLFSDFASFRIFQVNLPTQSHLSWFNLCSWQILYFLVPFFTSFLPNACKMCFLGKSPFILWCPIFFTPYVHVIFVTGVTEKQE